jgi:uncharacterized protein
MTRNRIIIFTRYPEPGKTKTRLIPALGAEGAAELYRKMTEHTISVVRNLTKTKDFSVEVRYDAPDGQLMNQWLGNFFFYRRQNGSDLGDRMCEAFQDAFNDGNERVLIIGCDCPGLCEGILERALEELARNDLVLGPANDGGYYLIGLRRSCPLLFRHVVWGTEKVFGQTLKIAESLGMSVALVDYLDDIDRPDDLIKLNLDL